MEAERGGGRKAGPSLGVGRRRKSSSSKAHALGRLAGEEGGKSWETWETSARMKSLFGEEDMGEGGIYLFIYALFKAMPSA